MIFACLLLSITDNRLFRDSVFISSLSWSNVDWVVTREDAARDPKMRYQKARFSNCGWLLSSRAWSGVTIHGVPPRLRRPRSPHRQRRHRKALVGQGEGARSKGEMNKDAGWVHATTKHTDPTRRENALQVVGRGWVWSPTHEANYQNWEDVAMAWTGRLIFWRFYLHMYFFKRFFPQLIFSFRQIFKDFLK